jgi:hypothetical protein
MCPRPTFIIASRCDPLPLIEWPGLRQSLQRLGALYQSEDTAFGTITHVGRQTDLRRRR